MDNVGNFEIIRITELDDSDRLDGRYPSRIGRRGDIYLHGCGLPMLISYTPRDGEDYRGTLRTSLVQHIDISNETLSNEIYKITTLNSIYYLRRLYI
jgi:hypothetical protein